MSIKLMAQVWELAGIKGTTQDVLLVLADHANDDGLAWPRVELIAWKVDATERHVQRLLRDLEARGLVSVAVPGGGLVEGGYGSSTVYRLDFSAAERKAPLPGRGDARVGVKGDAGARRRVTPARGKGDAHVTRTIKEPPRNRGGSTPREDQTSWRLLDDEREKCPHGCNVIPALPYNGCSDCEDEARAS